MTVLCVDDHPILLEGLAQNVHLVEPDADIYCFSDAKEAMAHAEKYGCDVLFTEIDLYHFSGIQLAKWIRKKFPRANIIFVTVCSEREHAEEVLRLRPSGYLTKPATREHIAWELHDLRYPVGETAERQKKRVCGA